jgi:hypothetical protein
VRGLGLLTRRGPRIRIALGIDRCRAGAAAQCRNRKIDDVEVDAVAVSGGVWAAALLICETRRS